MDLEGIDRTFRWIKRHRLRAIVYGVILAALAIATTWFSGYFGELGRSKAAESRTAARQAEWPDAFEQGNPKGQLRLYRRISLLREPGASLSIGRCPGPSCYRFALGRLLETAYDYRQEMVLDGGGFAAGTETRHGSTYAWTRYSVELVGSASMHGGPAPPLLATLVLHRGNGFKVLTQHADIEVVVSDTDFNRLWLDVSITAGTWIPSDDPLRALEEPEDLVREEESKSR